MRIDYFGYIADPFNDAFFDYEFDFGPDVVSLSSTQIVLSNPNNGSITTLTGSGFPSNPSVDPLPGTITSISVATAGGDEAMRFTGISWSLNSFVNAIDDAINGNEDPLFGLLSQSSITFDGSTANMGTDVFLDGAPLPSTVLGTPFQDMLGGGDGNDMLSSGGAPDYDGDIFSGSPGNDTYDYSDLGTLNWSELMYGWLGGAVTVNFNAPGGVANVVKANGGTDTLTGYANTLQWGMTFGGTDFNDTFNINGGANSWTAVIGGDGIDTYNLTLSSTIRLDLSRSPDAEGYNAPYQGNVVNLAANTISNDGYGNAETLNIVQAGGRLELRTSWYDDTVTGSDNNERFILQGGNDTLDAGGGWDVLRMDRNGVEWFSADLANGTASGSWNGSNFTYSLANLEEIRGSSIGDSMLGSDNSELFSGNDGNDSLNGAGGADTLSGGSGDDYLNPGTNDGPAGEWDFVQAGTGNDTIDASDIGNGFLAIGHGDLPGDTGINVEINIGGISQISKGAHGVTSLQGIENAIQGWGAGFDGTAQNDTFEIDFPSTGYGGWVSFKGGRGVDSFNILSDAPANATVRIDMRDDGQGTDATQGAVANLATGVISNDGFGNAETISNAAQATIELRGTDRNDNFVGSDASDRFVMGGGNDTVDGGAGDDLLRLDRSGYDNGVTVNTETGTATGTVNGVASTVNFSNIEQFRGSSGDDAMYGNFTNGQTFMSRSGDDDIFADGYNVVPFLDTANSVYRLYQATLSRDPDKAGHAGWTQILEAGSQNIVQVAAGFVGSNEFQNTYGGLDDAGFVGLLYQNVLGREASDAEVQAWLDVIAGGSDRSNVVIGFSESQEFINNTTGAATLFAYETNAAYWGDDVYRLYQATLARDPDVAGYEGWAILLSNGTELSDAAAGFVNSTEFQNVYGSLDDTQFVDLLYQNVLGRTGDAAEIQAWLDVINGGADRSDVAIGFSQSQEFINKTAADYTAWAQGILGGAAHDYIIVEGGAAQLSGGLFSDVFQFNASDNSQAAIFDFESHDILSLQGFGYNSYAEAGSHLSQQGADVVFSDQGTTITFEDTQLSAFDDLVYLL